MFFCPPEIKQAAFLTEPHSGDISPMLLGLISQHSEIFCSALDQLDNCNDSKHSPLSMPTQKKKTSSVITVQCPRFCTVNSFRERDKGTESCQDILSFNQEGFIQLCSENLQQILCVLEFFLPTGELRMLYPSLIFPPGRQESL